MTVTIARGALSDQCNSDVAPRPAIDLLVERAAKSMLAWSDRRAEKNQLTHERMALILENHRGAHRGGSSLVR